MRIGTTLGLAAVGAVLLSACFSDGSSSASVNNSTTEGTLVYSPPLRIASVNAADLTAQLNADPTGQGKQLMAVAGVPKCGVDFHLIKYATVGGGNPAESTYATAALMAPTGGAGCSGSRPILEYAHGTAFQTNFNIADPTDPNNPAHQEGAMMIAFYAAQGYIVVAPNYVGYDVQDVQTLPYHPYLNAAQQSQEMIDALSAARTALKGGLPSGDTDNGKLFITGYSQGGFVAMATHKAMQAQGIAVTASAPMSGPYAMVALFDTVMFGNVSLGATIYGPMVINSYQHAYGNIYNAPTDVYETQYAAGIENILPNALPVSTLIQQGKLPEYALFSNTTPVTGNSTLDAALAVPSNPLFALGFGPSNLLKNTLRVQYALDALASPDGAVPSPSPGVPIASNPQFPFRVALKKNDLRSWTPNGTAPLLLCGGHDDPEVFFLNTQTMEGYWPNLISTPSAANLVTVVDVDPGVGFAAGGIQTQIGTIAATAYGTDLATGVTSAATISSDVQVAIVTNAAFAPYFTAGVPNSPQGVQVAGLASVAAQAVATFMAGAGSTPIAPTAMGTDVANALFQYYHFPVTQLSCEVAAQAFFAHF